METTIKAILACDGKQTAEVVLPVEGNNTLLRPLIQLANQFEHARRREGARLLICERGVQGEIKATTGISVITVKAAVFEHNLGHPPRLILEGQDRKLVISNPLQYTQAVDLVDGGCLYCGCESRANCKMCAPETQPAPQEAMPA